MNEVTGTGTAQCSLAPSLTLATQNRPEGYKCPAGRSLPTCAKMQVNFILHVLFRF